jgi:lipopolysaccharide/colanic/teichoic acid biosynthesis glycosyltransferase
MIKKTSPGPVLFKQTRLTLNGREFTIYKFRSMRTDFDKKAEGIQVKGSSSAITPIGRILRKSKLDEIPQLINIIKGDMSFVGPRPELPRRLKYYSEEDMEMFNVRSGITSPASIIFSDEEYLMNQVNNPEKFYIEKIMPYKIKLNRYYNDNRSLRYDAKMVIYTVIKIFRELDLKKVVRNEKLLEEKQELVDSIEKEYQ